MTDQRDDDTIDELPDNVGHKHDRPPAEQYDDALSDIEQAVEARTDAVKRGDGGGEPENFTSPGMPDGVGGTGGATKNQDDDAQLRL